MFFDVHTQKKANRFWYTYFANYVSVL